MRYRDHYRPAMRTLGAPSRPNSAVQRGFYTLPVYSTIPLPTLPNVPQPGNPYGLGAIPQRRRRRMRGLGAAAGVPAGTTLSYTAQVTLGAGEWSLGGLVSDIAAGLQALGITIANSSASNGFFGGLLGGMSIVLVLETTTDYGQPNDVKSQVDHAIYVDTGYLPSSQIVVSAAPIAPGTPAPPPPPPNPNDLGTWLTSNWPWLALGAAGVYIAKDFI